MWRTSVLFLVVCVAACDCEGGGISQVEHRLSVDPLVLNFGEVDANQTAERAFQIANEGRAVIDLQLYSDGPYELGPWPKQLSSGESADVRVIFLGAMSGAQPGRISIQHDADGPKRVLLEASVRSAEPQCSPRVEPEQIHFDGFDSADVTVTNDGDAGCTIEAIELEGPGFEVSATAPVDLSARGTTAIAIRRSDGTAATLILTIDGDEYEVDLSAPVEGPHLCVTPQALLFGSAAETRELLLESCGAQPIRIDEITWTAPATELVLDRSPSLPIALDPGASTTVIVRYTPADELADRAVLTIRSNDALAPNVDVPVSTSPEMLPEEVGRFLYYWRITETEGSNIMKLPLQGPSMPTPFWGESTGQGCPGCHQISPDGRYVAITELGEEDDIPTTYVVDTTNNARVDLFAPATSAIGFSWRPDVTGSPPYRFAFSTAGQIHIGALFDGHLGELQGSRANDAALGQAMPAWGSDGRIAFVRGPLEDGGFGFYDFADLYTIPENGGTASPVIGASNNNKSSYYPQYSPDARWIAFTETSLGDTYAALDAKVRLVRADGSGVVASLDLLKGASGPTTFPSWSIDGTYLSVSSNRAGGAGDWDVYVAPIDPISGTDDIATTVAGANTAGFEHGAQWSR